MNKRQYDMVFKLDAAKPVAEQGYSAPEASQEADAASRHLRLTQAQVPTSQNAGDVAGNRQLARPQARGHHNQVWYSDITFVKTAEGWLYMAVVMDAYSKRIVGYAMRLST